MLFCRNRVNSELEMVSVVVMLSVLFNCRVDVLVFCLVGGDSDSVSIDRFG